MADPENLSRENVERLASHLGLNLSADRIDRIQTELAGGIEGYHELEMEATTHAPEVSRTDLEVTFDPGEDEDEYNAFISMFDLRDGDGPLSDLSLAVKDNIAIAGVPMTAGSAPFADAVPASDATVVERLVEAGATIVGKANMDELAYGPTGETSAFGPSRNPVAPDRVTGGSSSGSAAAVAGGLVEAALGTDTGGSVRIPASFCGIVGFKPTWGAISRYGVVELAYTLDHIGPLARDVETIARILEVLVGPDDRDPSTAAADDIAVDSFTNVTVNPPALDELRFGVPTEFFGDHMDEDVEELVRDHIDSLAAAGATVQDVSIPLVESAVDTWNAITNVEFSSMLQAAATPLFRRGPVDCAWQRDAAAGIAAEDRAFGDVIQRKAVEGQYLLTERDGRDYVAARNTCRALASQFAAALDDVDALVMPTMPVTAPERGTWSPHSYSSSSESATPPLAVNTRPADLAGIPAITVPAGTIESRPVGIQFVGAEGDDAQILAVGAAFEQLCASL